MSYFAGCKLEHVAFNATPRLAGAIGHAGGCSQWFGDTAACADMD